MGNGIRVLHEFAMAQSIVESVLEEAERAGAEKVTLIEIDVGELMQIDVPALRESLKLLTSGPRLKGARVVVRPVEASFSCRKCARRWGMAEAKRQLTGVPNGLRVVEPDSVELPLHFLPYLYPTFLRCPGCGSSDVEAAGGDEIVLRRVGLD